MKMKILIGLIFGVVLVICAVLLFRQNQPKNQVPNIDQSLTNKTMILTSSQFKNNDFFPAKYSCQGEGVNPPLAISGTPKSSKSLALVVDDPDAVGGTFVHWLAWNIDPATSSIAENSAPPGGIQGKNSGGTNSYYPPCPPSGAHHYRFKVYALDVKLDLESSADEAALMKAVEGHVLDQAELVGLYQKQ